VWLDMPPKARPKEIVVRLLRSVTGTCDSRRPVYELADELCEVLAGEPRVVVIDEAQHLDADGLHQLRYLHDRPDAR
jgi:DNA transposition AAA+ family ATPase